MTCPFGLMHGQGNLLLPRHISRACRRQRRSKAMSSGGGTDQHVGHQMAGLRLSDRIRRSSCRRQWRQPQIDEHDRPRHRGCQNEFARHRQHPGRRRAPPRRRCVQPSHIGVSHSAASAAHMRIRKFIMARLIVKDGPSQLGSVPWIGLGLGRAGRAGFTCRIRHAAIG